MNTREDRPFYGWVIDLETQEYNQTLQWQHGLVAMRQQGMARDTIMLVEHPAVVTVGKDGHKENFKDIEITPYYVERGGDVTYHGPGQLVAYFIFNLNRRDRDLRQFMDNIQVGIIKTLAEYDITARQDDEKTGVWVKDKKIASIGVAVKHWITFHGVAINLNTDLKEFEKINPCGLDAGVMTSLKKLKGRNVDLKRFSRKLIESYSEVFETIFAPVDLESLAEDLESQSGGYGV